MWRRVKSWNVLVPRQIDSFGIQAPCPKTLLYRSESASFRHDPQKNPPCTAANAQVVDERDAVSDYCTVSHLAAQRGANRDGDRTRVRRNYNQSQIQFRPSGTKPKHHSHPAAAESDVNYPFGPGHPQTYFIHDLRQCEPHSTFGTLTSKQHSPRDPTIRSSTPLSHHN